MTPRSLFSIIIKTVGIYLLISSTTFIPEFLTQIIQLVSFGGISRTPFSDNIELFVVFVLIAVSYLLIIRLFILKTDWLIDKLHIDQGFSEEKFEINIHRSTVLRIAVIVIGGLMVADSLPLFFKQLVSYFHMTRIYPSFKDNLSSGWMIYYFVKFFAGFALLSASRPIVNFIELKRKKPAQIEPSEE